MRVEFASLTRSRTVPGVTRVQSTIPTTGVMTSGMLVIPRATAPATAGPFRTHRPDPAR